MLIFSIIAALMVGGLLGVALMCMLSVARHADSDEAEDRPTATPTASSNKTWMAGLQQKRMHRAAARGEVACPPWVRSSAFKQPVLRMRATRA